MSAEGPGSRRTPCHLRTVGTAPARAAPAPRRAPSPGLSPAAGPSPVGVDPAAPAEVPVPRGAPAPAVPGIPVRRIPRRGRIPRVAPAPRRAPPVPGVHVDHVHVEHHGIRGIVIFHEFIVVALGHDIGVVEAFDAARVGKGVGLGGGAVGRSAVGVGAAAVVFVHAHVEAAACGRRVGVGRGIIGHGGRCRGGAGDIGRVAAGLGGRLGGSGLPGLVGVEIYVVFIVLRGCGQSQGERQNQG